MVYLVYPRTFRTGLYFSSQLGFILCHSVNKSLLTIYLFIYLLFKEVWKASLSQTHILLLE